MYSPWGVNDPDEGGREVITDPWVLKDSPLTWHNDGSKTYDTTWGNNAAAQANPTGATCDTCYTDDYRPESTTFDFEYDYSPAMTDPTSYCKYAPVSLHSAKSPSLSSILKDVVLGTIIAC